MKDIKCLYAQSSLSAEVLWTSVDTLSLSQWTNSMLILHSDVFVWQSQVVLPSNKPRPS